jgi:hypothetical protein
LKTINSPRQARHRKHAEKKGIYPPGVSGATISAAMETYFSKAFPAQMPAGHITGEASPGYMVYSEVPQRIKSQLPDVRILAVVRDPVTRAFSSYKYNYLRNLPPGQLPIPFGVMVREPPFSKPVF